MDKTVDILINILTKLSKSKLPEDKKNCIDFYINSLSDSDDLIDDAIEFITMMNEPECKKFYGIENVNLDEIWELV